MRQRDRWSVSFRPQMLSLIWPESLGGARKPKHLGSDLRVEAFLKVLATCKANEAVAAVAAALETATIAAIVAAAVAV